MDILEIFYNNVVPEAMNGRINCLSYYNMAFSTEIVDEEVKYSCNIDDEGLLIPTLMIKIYFKIVLLYIFFCICVIKYFLRCRYENLCSYL